ncbi:MAG: hypothetical protein NT007_18195 [Candidatus Kapabacteria bacterium]|nr:hypothetical protein [Candidatus Kapabacteria bacterium]
MKIYKLILCIFVVIFAQSIAFSKNYAILVSAGFVDGININDDNGEAGLWYDLVLAYEYLIGNAGYSQENVLVFYGDGTEWNDTHISGDRYNLPTTHPRWLNTKGKYMVNYSLDVNEFANAISDLSSKLTSKDNILVWWVHGHGVCNILNANDDSYDAEVSAPSPLDGWHFLEGCTSYLIYRNIYTVFNNFNSNNSNSTYCSRIKYLWATCRSGQLIKGSKTLLNGGNSNNDPYTFLITGCDFDELVNFQSINPYVTPDNKQEQYHNSFSYAVYCTLLGKNPWGGTIINYDQNSSSPSFSSFRDQNNDGVISMRELYEALKRNGEPCLKGISWVPPLSYDDSIRNWQSHQPPYSTPNPQDFRATPLLGDPCASDPSNYYQYLNSFYIDEVLKLQGHTLNMQAGETVRNYRVDQVIAGGAGGTPLIIPGGTSGSNINFVVDTRVHLQAGFHAESGCKFHAFIGEITCQ